MHLISLIPLYLYISLFNFYDDRWRVGLQSGGNNLHLWCFIYRAPASAPKPARFFGFSLLIGIFSVRASCSISWQGICFFCFIDFVPPQELLKQSFLGEGSQVLCVLQEHAGEGGQGGCTTQKWFDLFAGLGPWELAEPWHSFGVRCHTFFWNHNTCEVDVRGAELKFRRV